jgi:deazaflavin-dependent oxidoreductase (nitroreductase family)
VPEAEDDWYVAERTRNVLVNTAAGGRLLSALMLPWFTVWPPKVFGVLTTTGRKTRKRRRKCVRAVGVNDTAYLVSIRPTAWLQNIRSDPSVRLRLRGGTFDGVARELPDGDEKQAAIAAYCGAVTPFDYTECLVWRRGRPTRSKIQELHRTWCDVGTVLEVALHR